MTQETQRAETVESTDSKQIEASIVISTRPHITEVSDHTQGAAHQVQAGAPEPDEVPQVLRSDALSRSEIQKVGRICQPKPQTGKLDVPKDIAEMWNTPAGRKTLLQQWCKSGGVKAMHEVHTHSFVAARTSS